MLLHVIFWSLFSIGVVSLMSPTEDYIRLRLMTFNIWLSGAEVESGLYKIAKHIRMVDPDVVAIQELRVDVMPVLLGKLGDPWVGVQHDDRKYPDVAILTKHSFKTDTITCFQASVGAEIEIESGLRVRVVSNHFDYTSYGPYAANNKMVTRIEQIMAGETAPPFKNRAEHAQDVIRNPTFQQWLTESDHIPVFVMGDFNSPSHSDWGQNQAHKHGGWAVEWPATKQFTDIGFLDSFRKLYPNVTETPGITWSTVYKAVPEWNYTIPEPQDRVDFIFYKPGPVTPVTSFTYSGIEPVIPMPNHYYNDYPSDHFAVVTDFEVD